MTPTALTVAAALLLAAPCHAQTEARGEAQVALTFRHVWRGITRTSRISLQPELSAGARHRALGLAAGVWSSYALERVGPSESGLAERDYWVEGRVAIGAGSIGVGFIRYNFLGDPALGGLGPARNTSEIYGSLDLSNLFLAPRVDLYVDVDRIRGSYLAASLTAPFVAWPFPPPIAFVADLSTGLNISQAGDFAETGLSHTRLGIRGMWSPASWLTLGTGYRVQYSFDEVTGERLSGWGHFELTLHSAGS